MLKIFSWLLLLLGAVFVITSMTIFIKGKNKRTNCTKKVNATVVDIRKEDLNNSSNNIGEAQLQTYYPVYEYTINGILRRKKAFIGTAKPEVSIGQKVELYINPNNEDDFYYPLDKDVKIGKIFAVLGVVILLASIMMSKIIC